MKTVSVLIRTLNEEKHLAECIDSLLERGRNFKLDFVLVDSGSTDRTLQIAENYGLRVFHIPKKEFDYSKSLNLGMRQCKGEMVVILSAHSIPVEDYWLDQIISHFSDDKVAGVCTAQIPWPDAVWHEKVRLKNTFPDDSELFTKNSLSRVLFSNSSSCIRKSTWEVYPFVLPAVEDLDWATRVINNGYKIFYDASLSVYHSHNESQISRAKRLVDIEFSKAYRVKIITKLKCGFISGSKLVFREALTITKNVKPIMKKLSLYPTAVLLGISFLYFCLRYHKSEDSKYNAG